MSLVSDRKRVYGLVRRDQFGRRRRAARTNGSITNESWIRAGDIREFDFLACSRRIREDGVLGATSSHALRTRIAPRAAEHLLNAMAVWTSRRNGGVLVCG